VTLPEPNPLELLHQARRGDQRAAAALWSLFAPRLQALARQLVTTDSAGDVVQNVFVVLLRLPDSRVASIDDLAAYLAVSTRNACHNANRAAARHSHAITSLQLRNEKARAPEQDFGPLHAALGGLEASGRELVLLKHVVGLTFDQLALCLGERRGTIVSRYKAALETLRSRLEATGEPSARVPALFCLDFFRSEARP
jgi:RNA polymerase sigma factor (sigma-70 family)